MSNNTLLQNSTENGDIAGNDINKNTFIFNNENKSQLRLKLEQIKKECLHDPEFNKCIDKLTHYLNPLDSNQQRDLKTKLAAAGRQDEILEAEDLKEKFAKILARNSLSEQAQETYVHILSRIKILYDQKVKPLIKAKAQSTQIEESILKVIEALYEDLCGTALEHDYREIKGMLYFLAGNCHIEWSY